MDEVVLLTAILLMSILTNSGKVVDQSKSVFEIPFDQGKTEILSGEQTSKLNEARDAVIEAQKKARVERLIIEGYFTGPASSNNANLANARAAATKRWLQRDERLSGIAMNTPPPASGERPLAKISIR